jgi:diguanylate cyclase (GGDEF)-like protein/PAS domain S-box-containing protein
VHNRQLSILEGLVSGLLIAAAAFAAGAAVLSGRLFARWAALFLAAIFVAELADVGLFDNSWLTAVAGPYGLSALAIAVALAAGIRLVDYIASFAAFSPRLEAQRDYFAIAILLTGVAAFAGIPLAGLLVRTLAVIGAAAAAGYLAHCGRLGIAGARRLAPAATIFALVTAAATFHAFGAFGANLVASGAIGGFSAAGALLVALATAVPIEPAMERLRELREAHKGDEGQATVTDETLKQVRERAAVTASHQGVFDFDLHTGLVSLSAEAATLLGLPRGAVELSRETWMERIHPEDREVYDEAFESHRHHPGIAFRLEFRVRGAEARTQWLELRATMTGQATEAERCIGLIADVSARKTTETAEVAPAPSDALTGLGTRAALLSRLDALKSDAKRPTLAVFDIDRFKSINDSLGHQGGDALLVALTDRLERGLGAGRDANRARLFRVGGDMFAVMALGVTDFPAFGQPILDMMSKPFAIDGRDIYLPTNVGVATADKVQDSQELLLQGEHALLEAKREGGGRVCVYSNGMAKTQAHDPVALETELRRALERDEIEIYYQPIIRLKDGVVAGFEALVRWRHPERGLIEPDAFIPHAERSGLIVPLGRIALRRAAKDLARWQQFFPAKPPLYVSVNVTWRQIADEGFAKELGSVVKRAGLPKASLRLEVTESAVMAGAERAEAGLKRLKGLGASLAIDDFGTGHSSLGQLARLPFDTIKIDKTFLSSARDPAGAKILMSILTMAHELKLSVIAEGVETEADAALLKQIGCEQGQGYLFGAPLPEGRVPAYISAVHSR